MAGPTLRVVDSDEDAGMMTGRDLLYELAPIIERALHRIPLDDPWRPTLRRLATAAKGPRPGRTGA